MEVRGPLRPSKKPYTVEIAVSKDGRKIPVVNGKCLHSRYDPAAESRRWVAEKLAKKPTARLAIVLGMGFAYHIQALRESLPPDAVIVVFEPVSEVVSAYAKETPKNIDGVRLWPNPSPQDVVDAVVEVLTPTLINHVLIVAHPPSVELDPPAYQMMLNNIHSTVDQIAMSLSTGWGFGFEWIENAIRNVHYIPDLPFLNRISPVLRKAPPAALVLGAGPSLDQSWEMIREADVLKLAVDTALEPMQAREQIPHLAFLFDSQPANVYLVERIRAESVNLVTSLEVHPDIFKRRWKNLFLSSCDKGILSWLEHRGKFQAGTLKQGGSVVTCAFDLARQAGCSPIYFGGVDLSFTKNQVYCRNTAYERRARESQYIFFRIETALYEMKEERADRTVSGRTTQNNLYNYYRWLKDEIGRTAQPVILLNPTGLLTEVLPSDGAGRILAERFPDGFDENFFRVKQPPNGTVTREFLRDALSDLRRDLERFLAPAHFSDPDKLESALAESGLADILEGVVQPAVAVSRYERDKGGTDANLFQELRDRLARLLKLI